MNQIQKDGQTRERRFFNSRWKLVAYDLFICLVVEILFLLVYKGTPDNLGSMDVLLHMVIVTASIFGMRAVWKVYNQVWRYGGIQSYIRLLVADGCAAILYSVLQKVLPIHGISLLRSLSINCMCLLICLAIRMVYRYAYKCCRKDSVLGRILGPLIRVFAGENIRLGAGEQNNKIRVAIVGAGRVGVALAEELTNSATSSYVPKCFIDTNEEKVGRQIYNVPIIDEKDVTLETLDHFGVQEIIFALPRLGADEKRALYERYKAFGRKVKIYDYPVMEQVGEGKRHLREFDIEELLFRKPIEVADEKTGAFYRGKVVLITGGGGSIGSELCRQIAKMQPRRLVILDVYENGAYDVQQELKIAYGDALDLRVEILSVCNREALEQIFATYRPDVVLHAAAHKHVPLMEHNCCEAIENNVFGTLNVIEVAESMGVKKFVLISTDKAVNPSNIMGASKRIAEMLIETRGKTGKMQMAAVRFGNVLGSNGSVIPVFLSQIKEGGPITLTDRYIKRYFMSIPEAVRLVLQTGAFADSGEIFVLDMGEPVYIYDLACDLIRLNGLVPEQDIEIKVTGLRPGEKMFEELRYDTEAVDTTAHEGVFVNRLESIDRAAFDEKLARLRSLAFEEDVEGTTDMIFTIVPSEYRKKKESPEG